MNRKWFWVGLPLVALLAVAASVLLRDRSAPLPENEGAEAPAQRSEDVFASPDTPALPAVPPSRSALEAAAAAGIAAAATGEAYKTGDLTNSLLTGDGLGYLDVHAIINNNDPSSIVAFLLAHSDETGADESLEIEIRDILDYLTRKKVLFDQLIDGKHSIEGQGDITFDPATGAVHRANAWLVTADPALVTSVVILQDEAVAIARAAVASAVLQKETVVIVRDGDILHIQPSLRPGFTFQISRVTPKELRYALDPETNKTRAEWPVWISARGVAGGLSWEVLVDASTGEIAGINDLVQRYARGCSDLTFLVCDGSLMSHEDDACGSTEAHRVRPLQDSDPVAARVIGQAKEFTAKIKGLDPSYIGAARGSNCEVEIVVNVPDDLMGNSAGIHQPHNDRILLHQDEFDPATTTTRVGADRDTVAHEVMHALTETLSSGVEHGLVTAAEALFMCGADQWWRYGNSDFTGTPSSVSSGTHHSVAHAIYKIYGATNKDTAFKIVLASDRRMSTPTSAHRVIFEEAKEAGEEAAVTGIYKDMGIWPSQDDIDKIVDIVIKEIKKKTGPLLTPTQAEMEDKVEELVNEQLSNGEFNQGMIIVRAGRKAEEYRLEKVKELERAKEEYNKRLKEAMAQLTNEERAEIQGQYSEAQKKIQAATSRAIAQWNWEWIRDVIERIIKGREDDDTQDPVAPH